MFAELLGLGSLLETLLAPSDVAGDSVPRDSLGFCGGVMTLRSDCFVQRLHNPKTRCLPSSELPRKSSNAHSSRHCKIQVALLSYVRQVRRSRLHCIKLARWRFKRIVGEFLLSRGLVYTSSSRNARNARNAKPDMT